jgi:hypothetical protein
MGEIITVALVVGCLVAAALYLEKLAHEWSKTPASEPVDAGYGNVLLLLCLVLAGMAAAAVSLGLAS